MIDENTELWMRLLALMQLGGRISGADGHIWIDAGSQDELDFMDFSLQGWLRAGGIYLNSKIYGGVLEALDTIDAALARVGKPTLFELYSPEIQFLGRRGVGEDRIQKVKKGQGGVM